MKKLTPYDFKDIDDYINYIDKLAKEKSSSNNDDDTIIDHSQGGRNSKDFKGFDDDR